MQGEQEVLLAPFQEGLAGRTRDLLVWLGGGVQPPLPTQTRQMTETGKAGLSEESSGLTLPETPGVKAAGPGVGARPLDSYVSWATEGKLLNFSGPSFPLL